MENNTKKYGMGGAVQSFSSPMLAQGMQGGLSGFGTSGLGTFAKGGEVEEFQIGDVVTHKKGKQYGHGKIYKLSSIGFYLEDKYGNKSEKHQIIPSEFKKVKKLADGGQVSEIERILAKYKAMEFNKPKEDETSEFLRKSWEGKNIDDYVMYSDKYKRGGKMAQGGLIEHGLQEGDNIVKEVDNKWLIVKSKSGVFSVVDIEKGSRFIVGLDDSKTSGKRISVKAGVKQAMDYINYLKSTKMANGGTLDDAKIYVADLAEYNNGRLVGKWLDLSDYSSGAEVMEAIQEMLDEQTKKDKYGDVHEEYAIHDFEGFPRSFYSEYMGESDFDALYDIMKVADSSNLPLEVLMEAVSDLGYEDDPERVAEAYYSSVPASMGNEWRDFAYEYIDSIGNIIEAVSKPEYYFDFESFGSDVRMDYTDEELEEMGYNDLSDEELGEQMADEMGGVKNLGEKLIETYFDYDKFGSELEYDFISVRGKDGDYYFFNRNFAKGGKVKYAKGGEVKNTIDILMTEEPKVWDKFGFFSGSEIRASKDKTKKYAQELERVFTAKGVKKGSLTKKINEDLTDENYHLLNEFLTRNGYFNSKLTDELLKSYNNPVYSGVYADKEAMTIEEKAKPKTSGTKKIQFKKLSEKTTYIPNREIGSIELESGETLSKNDIIDGVYRAKKKFAKGGKTSTQKIYEVEYEIGGQKHTSQFLMYDSDRVENLLPPATKIISIKEKYAKGGEVDKKKYNFTILEYADDQAVLDDELTDGDDFYGTKERIIDLQEQRMQRGYCVYFTISNGEGWYYESEDLDDLKESLENSDDEDFDDEDEYAKGGKIGFKGLAKKVAKRYVGKKVSKEYQAEYGKTYDAKEAKEVGNKVAGKVYKQQVAKKKIVRKLQRKSK
jgi:antirestriction protein